MRHLLCHFGLTVLCGIVALVLTACGPSSSNADKQPQGVIHGEPIVSTPNPAPQPKADAIAAVDSPAPVPSANSTVVPPTPTAISKPASLPQIADEPKPPPATTILAGDNYPPVGFDQLASYNFQIDDTPFTNQPAADKANDQIPARVKAFDEKKVAIKGFMLPLKVSAGVVTEFLIMKDQSMCCYGSVPKITEWVSVKTTGRGVKPIMDQPISILGTLHVGAMRENGYLIGIYQMDGDKLVPPDN
ncbi:MAG: hypothetical protein JWQ04_1426 [Pedosphaera sp.]|nr:hypothetical protein [Pedosphaera sp.]